MEGLPFAEGLLYLPPGATSRLEPRWRSGFWLGVSPRTSEHRLFDTIGGYFTQARSIKRVCPAERDTSIPGGRLRPLGRIRDQDYRRAVAGIRSRLC